MNYIILIFCK